MGGRNNDHGDRGIERGGGGWVTGQRRSTHKVQHAQSLNDMLGEYRDIVGEEEVGGGRDEGLTAIGGKNAATTGVAGATSCVPNY